jgi:hypothetical protein
MIGTRDIMIGTHDVMIGTRHYFILRGSLKVWRNQFDLVNRPLDRFVSYVKVNVPFPFVHFEIWFFGVFHLLLVTKLSRFDFVSYSLVYLNFTYMYS